MAQIYNSIPTSNLLKIILKFPPSVHVPHPANKAEPEREGFEGEWQSSAVETYGAGAAAAWRGAQRARFLMVRVN